ncbi:MAG: hypothetical protein IJQ43_08890 [Oscillospiraceae bacterium]|nr:hypothetical protein [Oscillospiraceae bacterium]
MRIILNLILFLCTAWAYIGCFHDENGWRLQRGLGVLRFFTVQSNLLCGFASLAILISLPVKGEIPHWIWLWKYIGTAAVTVTLNTVLIFLGPAAGYKRLLSGRDLYLHLIGPLLAIVSFCFCERIYPLSFPLALTGLLPVILYGALYFYKVMLCSGEKRWEDFYGYNRNGKWPISCVAMLIGGALVCTALWGLYRL